MKCVLKKRFIRLLPKALAGKKWGKNKKRAPDGWSIHAGALRGGEERLYDTESRLSTKNLHSCLSVSPDPSVDV